LIDIKPGMLAYDNTILYIKTVDSTRRNQCIPSQQRYFFQPQAYHPSSKNLDKTSGKANPTMMAQGNESETYLNLGWTGPHITFGSGYDVAVGCPERCRRMPKLSSNEHIASQIMKLCI
jgi:hypothetical protein